MVLSGWATVTQVQWQNRDRMRRLPRRIQRFPLQQEARDDSDRRRKESINALPLARFVSSRLKPMSYGRPFSSIVARAPSCLYQQILPFRFSHALLSATCRSAVAGTDCVGRSVCKQDSSQSCTFLSENRQVVRPSGLRRFRPLQLPGRTV